MSPTRMINLDHQSTTPIPDEVWAAMDQARRMAGNPSATHRLGREARAALEDARDRAAAALGAPRGSRVIFTGSGTEANALALSSALGALGDGARMITFEGEHASVLHAARAWQAQGRPVTILPGISGDDQAAARLAEAIKDAPGSLISAMLVNNETGHIADVAALSAAAKTHRALWHCDGAAALGKLPFDLDSLGADLATFSAHKVGGPAGVGICWHRATLSLAPLYHGGAQEFGSRPGTQALPAIVGAALAVERAAREVESVRSRHESLRTRFLAGLRACFPALKVHEAEDPRRRTPGIVNVAFCGLDAQELLIALDLAGVAAARGSACESGAARPSHVLTAMKLPDREVKASLRFSFGAESSPGDIDAALQRIEAALARFPAPR